ncbi:MFS transporter [Lichenicoccus sp.]|uniref:MFS transporter n=1 Tax=Lichenicoccus sp. TaxID=2781899 RepID=UPI003D0D2C15
MTLSPRVRRMRVTALILLMVAGTVNYLDRSALSIGNSAIRTDLHLSDTQMGLLLSVFALAYGLAQLPIGILIDRFGPRRLLGGGLVLWSLAQAASGFVGSLGQFVGARAALGIGESPMYLAGTKVFTNWYPPAERSWPIGLFNASSALGPTIAPGLLTLLLLAYGWRPMFILIGIGGIAIALLWELLYRDPAHAGLDARELASIKAWDDEAAAGQAAGSWPVLFRQPTTWGMAIGFFGVIYLTWLYGTWLPDYLERERHLSVRAAGLWTAVPQACGFLGAVLGGLASRQLARRGMAPVASCKAPLIAGMLVTAACTAGAAVVQGAAPAIALISFALFAATLASSCGWAMAAVATSPDKVATLEAIQNIGGSLGGACAPAITGGVVQATGSFTPALLLAAAIAVLSAVIYGVAVREPRLHQGAPTPERR